MTDARPSRPRILSDSDEEDPEFEKALEAMIEVNGRNLLNKVALWSHETFQDELDKHLGNNFLRSFKINSIRRG